MSLGVLLLILYSLIDHLSSFSNFLTQEYYNQYSVPIDISSWTIKKCNVCYYAGYLFLNFNGIYTHALGLYYKADQCRRLWSISMQGKKNIKLKKVMV